MSSDVYLRYSDNSIQLDDLDQWLRAAAPSTWEIAFHAPRIREMPDTPEGREFARMHPGVYPRRDPGQVTVTEVVNRVRMYIQGRVNPKQPPSFFMVSFSQKPLRLHLVKEVLRILLKRDGSELSIVTDRTMCVCGSDWVRKVEEDPDWYWGHDNSRTPGPPFRQRTAPPTN